jgi:hypothetical protein
MTKKITATEYGIGPIRGKLLLTETKDYNQIFEEMILEILLINNI